MSGFDKAKTSKFFSLPRKEKEKNHRGVTLGLKNDIFKLRVEGYVVQEIITMMMEKYPGYSQMTIGLYYNSAVEKIHESSKAIVEKTINNHIDRYEFFYRFFFENKFYKLALSALKRKEALVGLSNDNSFEIELNSFIVDNSLMDINFGEMSQEEKKRLFGYINKIKIKKKIEI